jgi:hypothetical protein
MTVPKPLIEELRRAAKAAEMLTCLEAARLTGYSPDHISLMLRQKKLRGEKRGRDWQLDAKSLYEHVQENPGPGRKGN